MSDVFISYTRKNHERVKALVDLLRSKGIDVWWDGDIQPGTDYHAELEKQISAAKCVVVIWSNESVKREWVLTEADFARSRGVLIPALFDEVEPPLAFRLVQAANLITWTSGQDHPGVTDLISAISAKTSKIFTKTDAGPRPAKQDVDTLTPTINPQAAAAPPANKVATHRPPIYQKVEQVPIAHAEAGGLSFPEFVQLAWKLNLPGEVHPAPLISETGVIYCLTRNGALVCADRTGKKLWSAVVGGGRGLGGQGLVETPGGNIVAVTDGYINFVSPEGKSLWRWTENGGITSAPAIREDGTVIAMSNKSTLWAVSPEGKILWERNLSQNFGGGSWPSPAYAGDDLVYAACRSSNVYGVNAKSGEVLWEFPINDKVGASPVAALDGTGYFASDSGWVFAIDPAGYQKWVVSVSGGSAKIAKIDAPLSINSNHEIFAAPRHGKVFKISPEGDILWETAIGGQGTGDRAVACSQNGPVYASNTKREFLGISENGHVFLRVQANAWLSTPGVGAENTVYLVCGTELFALEVLEG